MTNRWRRDQELVGLRRSIAVLAKRLAALERQVAKIEELAEARAAVAGAVLAVGEKVERRLAALEAARPAPAGARRISPAQAAAMLDVSARHARRLAAEGRLGAEDARAPGATLPRYAIDPAHVRNVRSRLPRPPRRAKQEPQ